MTQHFDQVKGLQETMGKNGVASIYSREFSPKVWQNIKEFRGGKALFTYPATVVNCGGAPQKIAYLADCAWRSAGVRDNIDMGYFTASTGIFGCQTYRMELEKIMTQKGIHAHVKMNLVEVIGEAKLAVFETDFGERVSKHFDFLHVTPPMGAPEFIKKSPLANTAGFVEVDEHTCQHKKFPNIFSLGDGSSLPTGKTYSAIASEAPPLVHNVLRVLEKQPEKATALYDGYTACPILLGGSQLMLAEFNGYSMQAQPSFWPLNQTKGFWPFFLMKRYVFEQVYWHFMPLGRWYGKYTIFEPPLQHLESAPVTAQEANLVTGSQAALHAPGVSPEILSVVTPDMPGNVSLSGVLSEEAVTELAPRYRGWLYLNGPDHPAYLKKEIEDGGCRTTAVPIPPVSSGVTPSSEIAEAVLNAMAQLPRPLMVQCTAGNRSGASLLLWLVKQQNLDVAAATKLAEDLNLSFWTDCEECGPIREWVLNHCRPAPGATTATA